MSRHEFYKKDEIFVHLHDRLEALKDTSEKVYKGILVGRDNLINNRSTNNIEAAFAYLLHDVIKPLQQRVAYLEYQLKKEE